MIEALLVNVELVASVEPFSPEILLGLVILMQIKQAECFSFNVQIADLTARHFVAVFVGNLVQIPQLLCRPCHSEACRGRSTGNLRKLQPRPPVQRPPSLSSPRRN